MAAMLEPAPFTHCGPTQMTRRNHQGVEGYIMNPRYALNIGSFWQSQPSR